jgi:integrase
VGVYTLPRFESIPACDAHRLSASSHRQALSALPFLYSRVLAVQLPWLAELARPRVQRRLPVVLSRTEVAAALCRLEGEQRLFAQLLYGTGMRLSEALALRVKDVDFSHRDALERKYPRAGASWSWFWVFPQGLHRSAQRRGAASSHARPDLPARLQARRRGRRHRGVRSAPRTSLRRRRRCA